MAEFFSKELSSDALVREINITHQHCQPSSLWFDKATRERSCSPEEFTDTVSDANVGAGPPSIHFPSPSYIPTGAGTVVAVLDSGVNTTHTALAGKILSESKSFVIGSIEDTLGHGTQCAGLVCGSKDTITVDNTQLPFSGIATDARVLVCKVVPDGKDEADMDAVIQALDYVKHYNKTNQVSVVSLSFGMSNFNRLLAKKIEEVIYDDIIVVCAASNDGRKVRQPINFPARLGHVLCIGSCNSHGKVSDFSPVGREIDFLAYGEDVWAPTSGRADWYRSVSGTSFAAPLVAGIVCQVVEDLRRFDSVWMENLHNVWGMRELLKHMAVVQGSHSEEAGFGLLNPMEYFDKTQSEKEALFRRILCN